MIDPNARKRYLRREFEDHTWMKDLSERELDQMIGDIRPRPQIIVPLRKHQKVCLLLAIAYPGFYFQLDMGTGKTLLMLTLMDYFLEIGLIKKCLIEVPEDEHVDGWEEEIEKWYPDMPRALLHGSTEKKWDLYNNLKRGLAIVSYPGLSWMLSEKEERGKGKKAHNELVPKSYLLRKLVKGLDAYILDEITKTMNSGSLPGRLGNSISKHVRYCYGLAGRAFGRNPEAVWQQFKITDQGETFGNTLGFFRSIFFDEEPNPWGNRFSMNYKFRKNMRHDFYKIMAHRSITYDTSETDIILPPVVYDRINVTLPKSSEVYYQKTLEELKRSRGNYREVQNNFLRLRQIASGFVGFYDDEEGEKAQLEFPDNPKLSRLLAKIEQIRPDRKFVICHDFTWSGAKISQSLRKMKIEHGWLWSGTKNWPEMKKRFDRDPKFRGLIVQNKKGSYGLNLQAANYQFYYERPISVLDYDQSRRRCRRDGQKHTVFIYDLVMKDTADVSIIRFHSEGQNLFRHLVKDPERALRMAA